MNTAAAPSPPSTAGQTFPVETLTPGEARRLLDSCSRRSPSGQRMAAVIAVAYRSGLRLSELLALELRDVDQDAGSINVRRGKGARQRIVGIDTTTLAMLDRWLTVRQRIVGRRAGPIFCQITTGREGRPLDPSYVRKALKRLAVRAGIDKRVHPHGLRHTFATELAGEGCPGRVIQQALGHSSLATTDTYLRKLRPQELIDAMARRNDW